VLRRGVALLLLVLAGVVLVVAVVDHSRKNARTNRMDVDNWYCQHLGERCETPDADTVEVRWERRELAYKGAMFALVLGAVGFAIYPKSLKKGFNAVRRNR
jgi:hypothetical protein